jgi:hypothetical protein
MRGRAVKVAGVELGACANHPVPGLREIVGGILTYFSTWLNISDSAGMNGASNPT